MAEAVISVTITDPEHPLYGQRFAVVPALTGQVIDVDRKYCLAPATRATEHHTAEARRG